MAPFLVVVFLLSACLSQQTQREASSQEGYAVGGDFVRINVLSGAMVTDQGVIEGNAFEVMRLRRQLVPGTKILGDVHVKRASPLGNLPIEIAARDTAERGLADALVLFGTTTGQAANLDDVRCVRSACPEIPLLIGSGVTVSNGAAYLEFADGVIVGTSVKRDFQSRR